MDLYCCSLCLAEVAKLTDQYVWLSVRIPKGVFYFNLYTNLILSRKEISFFVFKRLYFFHIHPFRTIVTMSVFLFLLEDLRGSSQSTGNKTPCYLPWWQGNLCFRNCGHWENSTRIHWGQPCSLSGPCLPDERSVCSDFVLSRNALGLQERCCGIPWCTWRHFHQSQLIRSDAEMLWWSP